MSAGSVEAASATEVPMVDSRPLAPREPEVEQTPQIPQTGPSLVVSSPQASPVPTRETEDGTDRPASGPVLVSSSAPPAAPQAESSGAPLTPSTPPTLDQMRNDPNLVRVFDQYGQEVFLTRQQWRDEVLPANLQGHWNDPDALYSRAAECDERRHVRGDRACGGAPSRDRYEPGAGCLCACDRAAGAWAFGGVRSDSEPLCRGAWGGRRGSYQPCQDLYVARRARACAGHSVARDRT